ncbi:hypothetical protein GIB67_016855 [Kingdonia uniflora]|uniref:Peptidase C30 domain-containing protein n=1 Tax=Kingdonia uniflora TaxID=39325 RepID=A0A7J7LQ44_9MAGN|nr:hypothetical protein GIB67_016855 [Kingdonia uniflora]
MAPRIRAGTKRQHSTSTCIFDGQRVRDNPVYWSTENGFKDRPIVNEHIVDIQSVSTVSEGFASVFAKFKMRGWAKILTPMGKVYPCIV